MAAVLAILVTCLGPATELGKCIVAPIKRQFDYFCCFNSNIRSLRNEAGKLGSAINELQMQVDRATRNVEVISPEVEAWLTSAREKQRLADGIETRIFRGQTGCLNVKSRSALSGKAKKTAEAMKELREGRNFSILSHRPPPVAVEPIPCRETYDFESRKGIEEGIMGCLRDNIVKMVGICGMGGVGKTTILRRITERAREEDLFDEIVMVDVGQEVDMSRIQHEIADNLGLRFEEGYLRPRARILHSRLKDKKRTLIVFDDVWERLNLEDLGISCESGFNECTILVASRDRGVLDDMDVLNVFAMDILLEEEARFLFRNKAMIHGNDESLLSIAEEVTKECGGLPLALITVGGALKTRRSEWSWRYALEQLKYANPGYIENVLPRLYKPLKLSYDFLENEQAKSLFLLCSLFPEDYNIQIECLTWCMTGLCMFKGINNLEEARNTVHALVEVLKSRFLLLDGRNEQHVKMHDVVRDVAIFIASKEGRLNLHFSSLDWSREQSYSDCTWISMIPKERYKLPEKLYFQNLRLLLIYNSEEVAFHMNDDFFQEMKALNVLSFKSVWFKSLPPTIQLLKNLHTLHLESSAVETISVVGELSNLEILSCHSCRSIEEIPAELGKLKRLRLLEFSDCTRLTTIVPGVLSNLVRLEELKMIGSFSRWETEEKEEKRKNVSLNELESLPHLTRLEIEIFDSALAEKEILLSSKIAKYDIRISGSWPSVISTDEKKVLLSLSRQTKLANWIYKFLNRTEYLDLTGEGSNSVDLTQVQKVKSFGLSDCSTVKNLVSTASSIDWRFGVFPALESMWLCRLYKLEEICHGKIPEGSNSFGNLKYLLVNCLPELMHLWKSPDQNVSLTNLRFIHIWYCKNLYNLFPLTIARSLSQLEMLEIRSCDMMEEIFSDENDDGGKSCIAFPKLKRLSLWDLPSLTTFCKGVESINFPLLAHMGIENCPKLIDVASSTGNDPRAGHDDGSLHLFCNQKVSFGSLKELKIGGYENISNTWCCQIPDGFYHGLEQLVIESCHNISSLFSSSQVAHLVNLKELKIESCLEIVKVITDEENVHEKPSFPSLELLELRELPNLGSFCEWRRALELPSLKQASIYKCPQLRYMTLASLTTPNLETVGIDHEYIYMEALNDSEEGLNGVVRRRMSLAKDKLDEVKQVSESMRTRQLKTDLFGITTGRDEHGCVKCKGKEVAPTQSNMHSSNYSTQQIEELVAQVTDQLLAKVRDEIRAEVQSRMENQMEVFLNLLHSSTSRAFHATCTDPTNVASTSGESSNVHAFGSQVMEE
ncbi:putative disease resistance protein [Sesamum alatum]|uniref:Disease resistance protein n=1 Tax=Sesamum alatum TaxID=300844 RepID=A0AAE2C8F2_9LAMI|nr:putative disease resistance protein [Sesamum alatum]